MRGFRRFSDFLSSRSAFNRALLLEDINPLVHPSDILSLLDSFGPNSTMLQFHCPVVGSYTRKMLVVMESQEAAKKILSKSRYELENKTWVTVSRYRKLGKLVHGQYLLYLMTERSKAQVTLSEIEQVGTDLANIIHDAFEGYGYTSFRLMRTKGESEGIYTGIAKVRFADVNVRQQVLEQCRVKLKTNGLWVDIKNKSGRIEKPEEWCTREFEAFNAEKDKESASGGAATNAIPAADDATVDHKEETKEDV